MKKTSCYLLAFGIMMSSCNTSKKEATNPFFSEFNTPHNVPAFDIIKTSDYMPAFERGIADQKAEIAAIVANTEAPTFANTIDQLERSGVILNRVSNVFFNIKGTNKDVQIDSIAEVLTPILSAHGSDINLNAGLFKRVKAIYDQKDDLKLSTEQLMVLKEYYNDFVRGGANLSAEDQTKLRAIKSKLSKLYLKFGNNVVADNNAFTLVIDNEKDLAGLPESVKTMGAEAATEKGMAGKWVYTLDKPSLLPFLTYSSNRALREKMFKGYTNKGNNNNEFDNKKVASDIVLLRTQKANVLGYKCFADYRLEVNMAKNSKNVYELCNKIWAKALPAAKAEAKELQKMIKKDGKNFKLEAWDWWYYTNKLKMEKYNLDEEMLKPYLKLENVRDGAFYLANKLYGINFKQVTNLPLYHKDATTFEVTEANGDFIGVLYMDFFPRKSKRGGAWMTSFRKQSALDKPVTPVISVVCNFSKPSGDKPALLSWDETTTLFHEFGHSLHGLLSKCKYNRTSGTSTPRDFVELPSQLMENWCGEPEMLKIYAKHYKTGEIMPLELVKKLTKSSQFNTGFTTTEFMAAALLDLAYHTQTTTEPLDIAKFEKETLDKMGMIPEIAVRYRSTYFNHIFSSEGYATGYYAYTWAEVLDADAFNAFKETGDIFNPKVAKALRENIISRGGSDDVMKLYLQFRGQQPDPDALLRRRGLIK
ncbi:MAG: M3 family metallopeptidase [Marinifilaceae bacterium]